MCIYFIFFFFLRVSELCDALHQGGIIVRIIAPVVVSSRHDYCSFERVYITPTIHLTEKAKYIYIYIFPFARSVLNTIHPLFYKADFNSPSRHQTSPGPFFFFFLHTNFIYLVYFS